MWRLCGDCDRSRRYGGVPPVWGVRELGVSAENIGRMGSDGAIKRYLEAAAECAFVIGHVPSIERDLTLLALSPATPALVSLLEALVLVFSTKILRSLASGVFRPVGASTFASARRRYRARAHTRDILACVNVTVARAGAHSPRFDRIRCDVQAASAS